MPLFDFDSADRRDPKIHVHVSRLPAYIDPKQSPTKKSPWRTINNAPMLQSVNMILPEELYNIIWGKIEDERKKAPYVKVIMKLQDLLEGAFFTEYIKKGNVLMISEGRPGVDNVFSLRNGVLSLDVDKESYQRSGLQGKPVSGGGRMHVKARYLIEIELRKPSMLHGKKGFEKVVYAAKKVLNESLTWLFCDLREQRRTPGSTLASSPIDKHHPTMIEGDPMHSVFEHVLTPSFGQVFSDFSNATVPNTYNAESTYEVTEWLGLVVLQSPRLLCTDSINPYLSRYAAPDGSTEAPSLRIINWHGLISTSWLADMLNMCIRQSRIHHAQQWLAISAFAHRLEAVGQHDGYSIILLPEVRSPRTEDQSMEVEPGGTNSGTRGTVEIRSNEEKHPGGLQNCMCFEHIDSVVGS